MAGSVIILTCPTAAWGPQLAATGVCSLLVGGCQWVGAGSAAIPGVLEPSWFQVPAGNPGPGRANQVNRVPDLSMFS